MESDSIPTYGWMRLPGRGTTPRRRAGRGSVISCKPETKVIELRSLDAGPVIENLAKKNDLDYYSITVKAKQIYKQNFPNQQGSIQVPISSLDKILR